MSSRTAGLLPQRNPVFQNKTKQNHGSQSNADLLCTLPSLILYFSWHFCSCTWIFLSFIYSFVPNSSILRNIKLLYPIPQTFRFMILPQCYFYFQLFSSAPFHLLCQISTFMQICGRSRMPQNYLTSLKVTPSQNCRTDYKIKSGRAF